MQGSGIQSGFYLPDYVAVSNIVQIIKFTSNYVIVGQHLVVFGTVSVEVTAANVNAVMTISHPLNIETLSTSGQILSVGTSVTAILGGTIIETAPASTTSTATFVADLIGGIITSKFWFNVSIKWY